MADENEPAAPAPEPTPAPAPDYAAKFAEMEARLAEEREARQRERQEADARHQETLAQVAGAIGALREPTTTPVAEDEGAIITRGDLRRELSESMSTLASATQNSIAQENTTILKNQRQTNRVLAANDPSLAYFTKYGKEVDAHLDKLPPHLAAAPDAYQKVYRFVLSQHAEEVEADMETRIREKVLAELRAAEDDPYEPATPTPNAPAPAARREPPMPRGDGGRQAISSPSAQGRMPKLTEDERWACDRYFGGDRAAYLKERDQPTTGESLFRAKR